MQFSLHKNGKKSVQYIDDIKQIIRRACQLALMSLGRSNSVNMCLEMLFKCNEILNNGEHGFFPDLVCVMWNNLGCAYRRIGQLQASQTYFEKALLYMKKFNIASEAGSIFLNLSALYAFMGRYARTSCPCPGAQRRPRLPAAPSVLADLYWRALISLLWLVCFD